MDAIKRKFDPKMDSPIYRQILDFAQHNGVKLRPQFLDELEIFATEVEAAFQRKLSIEMSKPMPTFFVTDEEYRAFHERNKK